MTEAKERCNNSSKATCLQIIIEDHHKGRRGERKEIINQGDPKELQQGHLHLLPLETEEMLLRYSRSAHVSDRW